MINFTSINNITVRRAASLFGQLNTSITWDLLESTKDISTNEAYHNLITDILTNEDNYYVDDPDYVLPCSYIFASLEDFESDNSNSHLTMELIRELLNHVTFKLEQLHTEKEQAEELINKILAQFGMEENQEQNVQTFIWDSEEDSYTYKAYLLLVDLVDSSLNSGELTEFTKEFIPTFNY